MIQVAPDGEHQGRDLSMPMVAGDDLVQSKPDLLHGVVLGSVRGQVVKSNPLTKPPQLLAGRAAPVNRVVVHQQVNSTREALGPADLLQQGDEQATSLLVARHITGLARVHQGGAVAAGPTASGLVESNPRLSGDIHRAPETWEAT
jgi:hypothetical protein